MFVVEQKLGDAPALPFATDQIADRHPHVVEEGFIQVMGIVDTADRTHRNTGRAHVDQQKADPCLLLHIRVGAYQHEDPVRVMGITGPDFLAIDHVVVAIALGAGAQRCQVGTGARFRKALAPQTLAIEDGR
ncbi:hypothetical protein D3C84_618970 [compost metagenome]